MGFIYQKYRQTMIRQDEQPYLQYFRLSQFPYLHSEPYSFLSDGNTLRGFFYFYADYNPNVLVIFCHGIGGGHSSYLKEINELAKAGYKVLAYDNTGCVNSEGRDIYGLSSSLRDLNWALESLRKTPEYTDKQIYVIGHSWGAYAAANIYNYQLVDKIVAISPFISIKSEYGDIFKGLARLLIPSIIKIEAREVGQFVYSDAINSLNKNNARALIIHSRDDSTVSFKSNTGKLMKKIHNPKVEFYILDKKDHHPQYSDEAVQYFLKIFRGFDQKIKNKSIKTLQDKQKYFQDVNFQKATEQDPKTWQRIITFLKA